MASSQVEIASSSSPFGHVLRDRNRRCSSHRDSNAFHKNLKDLVDTHIHSHISSSHLPTSSSNHQGDFVDLWVHKPQWDNNENNPTTTIIKKSSHKWDRAREMMLSRSKHRETPQTDDVEVPNLGGVSTLVRRWRDFETVSKINVNNSTTTSSCSTRSNDENAATIEAPTVPQTQRSYEDTCDESSRFGTSSMSISGDSSDHGEQDKTELPSAPQDSNEREKLRVADIIRKLASSKGEENHESEHGGTTTSVVCGESLPRIKTSFDHSEQQQQQQQQRIFFPVLHSPRIIRGRQALSDLFLQMERDRHRELEALKQRTAVSKFQQRGRIQALLKVRFLRRGTDARADRSTNGTLSESNRKSQSAIMHIRERFNTQSQNGVADSRSISREATNNNQESRNSTLNQQGVQNCDRENKVKLGSELPSYSKQREENQQGEIIREGAGIQSVVGCSRSTYRAVEDGGESGFVSTSTQENHPQEPSDPITLRKKMLDNISQVGKVFASNQLEEKNHNGEVNKKISPKKVTTNVKVTTSSNLQKETTFQTQHSDSSCSPNHNKVDGSHPGVKPSLQYRTSQIQSSDISHDQANLGNTNCEASHEKLLEIVDTPELPKESVHIEEQGENNQQCTGTSNERSSESTKPQSDWEEETTNQNLVNSDCGWVSDYSHTPSGWDELQSDYQQQSESNQDWVSDIARPRKEWEGLRQARYQEMLDPFIDNHDIRQLLHRKSVSIFLNSGLREKIDRLMASRSQQIPNAMSDQVGARATKEDAKEKEVVFDITKHQMVPHNETHRGEGEYDEEKEDSGYEDDFEDENTPILQQYLETVELVDQNRASQDLGSWSNNQERGVRNGSYHFPSNSLLQSQSPDFYSHHNQQCTSFTRHPSAEMELIYDLRGHMEQLHQEIFEIRRSIQSCMNMQMKLQHSIKKEVAAAITQSGPLMGSTSDKKGANCCVCYEGQVDSLLYRCGHICTCFRCAHELLWGTGKCPICQSPIIDVVRAYINNNA